MYIGVVADPFIVFCYTNVFAYVVHIVDLNFICK